MVGMKLHAIMIAVPAQGHLNPYVHLAIKLASKGLTITFVNIEFAHHLISKSHHSEVDIFAEARKSGLDIRYTTIHDGFPLEFDRSHNLDEYWESILRDFPALVDEFVGKIIESSDPSLVPVLVTDTVYSWTSTIAKKYKLVNVSFWTEPAIVFATNYYLDLLKENGHFPPKDNIDDDTINYIPGVESIRTKDLMSHLREVDTTTIIHKMLFSAFEEVKKADFILCNTVQEQESDTLSALNQSHPTYAIGPINFSPQSTKTNVSKSLLAETNCIEWLDSKPPESVVYISFGSVVQTDKHVIEEIANGLLLSEVNFIWVVRPDFVSSIDDNTDILPVGFKDNVKEKGLIVPWCNQNTVLSNPAVGGFLTHCGWNSVLESMWYGVPMICYPLLYDQPTNRKLVVDDWKIGINLCDGISIHRQEVAVKIKSLMGKETSNGIRHEIKKVKSTVHNALVENGSSDRNFDQFLKDLTVKAGLP